MAAGTCGPSFEARREERRAPQDDGGVWNGGHGARTPLLDDEDSNTYRAVYTVRFAGVVYVLHAFQKKSKKGIETPKRDIEVIKARLKLAEAHYRENYGKGART
jgi:phage-related protein